MTKSKHSIKALVINADDVGFSDCITEAAVESYKTGRITGVSVLACGRSFETAVNSLVRSQKDDVGVHLALTDNFHPCAERSSVSSLLTKEETFVDSYNEFVLRFFAGMIDLDQVYVELRSQIKKILDRGLHVTHLDSHEHIGIFPPIFKIVERLAKEFDIHYIRNSLEPLTVMTKSFRLKDLARYMLLFPYAFRAKRMALVEGRIINDRFLGHFHSGRIEGSILKHLLYHVREGITELATHISTSQDGFSERYPQYQNAERELMVWMEGGWNEWLEARKVKLITHREVGEQKKGLVSPTSYYELERE